MKLFLPILFSAAAVIGFFFLIRSIAVFLAKRELSYSHAAVCDDTIQIYAQSESLEYYIRCALVAGMDNRTQIVVNIRKDDENRDEMIDIARRFSGEHQNLTYRLI